MPSSPSMHLVVARAALLGYSAFLAAVLLSPSAAGPSWLVLTASDLGIRAGLPALWVTPARMEFLLNVAAFAPVTFLGALVWPRLTWRDWTAAGFLTSFLVEAVQALALDGRSATHADVVANTLGGLVGALIGAAVLARLATRLGG